MPRTKAEKAKVKKALMTAQDGKCFKCKTNIVNEVFHTKFVKGGLEILLCEHCFLHGSPSSTKTKTTVSITQVDNPCQICKKELGSNFECCPVCFDHNPQPLESCVPSLTPELNWTEFL